MTATSASAAIQYYPEATTVIRLGSAGYSSGNTQGYVDVTYFVAFKGWNF